MTRRFHCIGLASIVVAGLGVGLSGCSAPAPSTPVADGDAARGEQLYYDHACYSCHGYTGQTGARDLVGTGSPIVENVEAFLAFLRLRGDVVPAFPSTAMPHYSVDTLGDAAARDIFAYIQTFRLDAPEAADEPALRAVIDSAGQP